MTSPERRHPTLEAAATVAICRDGREGLEVLLVRRSAQLAFAASHRVFPGGRVEPSDADGLSADDQLGAARRAAVRKTAEETAVALDPDTLVWFSHWTPPPTETRLSTAGTERVALYHGDAGYEASDATLVGPRHRLVMADDRWRYERDDRPAPRAPEPPSPGPKAPGSPAAS